MICKNTGVGDAGRFLGQPKRQSKEIFPPSLFIDAFLFDLISFFEQQNFFDLLFHSNLK